MSSSHQPDLYAILGVTPSATAEQLTHAYRDLLRRHHPDTRPTTPGIHDQAPTEDARLQQVIHAYAVLRDPAQRARYDDSRQPEPQQGHQRQRTAPPPSGTVVIGTVAQPLPAWIAPADAIASGPNRLTPTEVLERLLRDLFDGPR